MQPRIDYANAAPGAVHAMRGLEKYLSSCSLEPHLIHLVKMRASQLNGCAFCLDMHSRDLRARGETEQRIYLLDAWRETQLYTDRERAALEWTEALTFISHGHVPDDVFQRVSAHFTETELVDLTLAVATINAWNRFAISFRSVFPAEPKASATA